MSLSDLPEFDELFVVSDLHFGGVPGTQIFKEGPRLAQTIRRLAALPSERVALVLAGDVVDFLAAPDVQNAAAARYLDTRAPIRELDRIRADPAFSPVFDALKAFVATAGRRLVIILGNHDVELALPQSRRWLLETLAPDDITAQGRIELALDGWGWSARVGGKRVLVVHGNEVDDWNVVDHKALLDVNRALMRGLPPPEWKPNAGTKLVIDLMNRVKRNYPMVDLVKPENAAAVPIVAALDPGANVDLMAFLRTMGVRTRDKVRLAAGFLGEEQGDQQEQDRPLTDAELFDLYLAPVLQAPVPGSTSAEANAGSTSPGGSAGPRASGGRPLDPQQAAVAEMLWKAKKTADAGADPRDLSGEGMLGAWDRVRDFFSAGKPGSELMRKALAKWWLKDDATFEIDTVDQTYEDLDRIVGAEVDFLIAGHTHLHRALERKRARGRYYFNSGTWIRLIQLTRSTLEDPDKFATVWEAFSQPTIQALDDIPGLVLRTTTVVGIHDGSHDNGGRAYGQLYIAQDDGSLADVANSRFPRP